MYADLPILFLLYYLDVISQMLILLIIRYIFTKIIEKTKNYCIFKHFVIFRIQIRNYYDNFCIILVDYYWFYSRNDHVVPVMSQSLFPVLLIFKVIIWRYSCSRNTKPCLPFRSYFDLIYVIQSDKFLEWKENSYYIQTVSVGMFIEN